MGPDGAGVLKKDQLVEVKLWGQLCCVSEFAATDAFMDAKVQSKMFPQGEGRVEMNSQRK